MTINIIQTITKVLTEDGEIISENSAEGYSLTPAAGKMLRNKLTGESFIYKIYIYKKANIQNFEEVDIPKKEKEN